MVGASVVDELILRDRGRGRRVRFVLAEDVVVTIHSDSSEVSGGNVEKGIGESVAPPPLITPLPP